MKNAALSISNNVSEDAARKTKKDKDHFFVMARSSTAEVDDCPVACLDLKLLKKPEITQLAEALAEVFKLISGLINSNEK